MSRFLFSALAIASAASSIDARKTRIHQDALAPDVKSKNVQATPDLRGGWWGSSSDNTAKKEAAKPATTDSTKSDSSSSWFGTKKEEAKVTYADAKNGVCPMWCYMTPIEWCKSEENEDKKAKVATLEWAKTLGYLPSWKPECCESEAEKNSWSNWAKQYANKNLGDIKNYAFYYTIFFAGLPLLLILCCCCCCCKKKKSKETGYYYGNDY